MTSAARGDVDRDADDAALGLLRTGSLEIQGLLPGSSNYTFLARVRSGDDETLAVYKPRRGEMPLWDFPEGTLCQREVAAYVVARELGWPYVPPTVLRDGPEGEGAVQLFVPHDPEEHAFTLAERGGFEDALRRVAAFDVVVNNADRKGGHCLLADDGRLFAIDHGVCFSEEPKLRTVIWAFVDDPLPDDVCAGVERLAAELRADGPLRRELAALLDEDEIDATAERAGRLVAAGRFPRPGPGRPYPWPPI